MDALKGHFLLLDLHRVPSSLPRPSARHSPSSRRRSWASSSSCKRVSCELPAHQSSSLLRRPAERCPLVRGGGVIDGDGAMSAATTSTSFPSRRGPGGPTAGHEVEMELFLQLLPPRMRAALRRHSQMGELVEVVMDLGRKPLARFPSGDWVISQEPVMAGDLDHAISKVGDFSDDNRSGINNSLHRISAIRNRKLQIIGLTCRVGRAVSGSAEIIRDLVEGGGSILVIGPPGVGKTTLIREIARMLADVHLKRVVIVDTSNEIGGDGDVPHPGIGRARRMQVPTEIRSRSVCHRMAALKAWRHSFPMLLLHCLLPRTLLQVTAGVPALIIFGDSTVDPGNNNAIPTLLRSNFAPYGRDFFGGKPTGRFCNGRLATDFLSEAFGLPPTVPAYLDPAYGIRDFAVGVSFASAGTGLDNATSDVLAVIPLWEELAYFKDYIRKLRRYMGQAKAQRTLREALYIVSIGTNDFLENYYTPGIHSRSSELTVAQFEDFLLGIAGRFITEIYRLGARKISFSGLSLMGCLPMQRTLNAAGGGSCVEEYNQVAKRFNAKLHQLASRLRSQLPGIRLVISDLYDYIFHVFKNPSSYGFDNVAQGCCSTGLFQMGYLCDGLDPLTCPDANKYAFWDASHPTERMNRLIANQSLNTALAEFLP